MKNSSEIDKVRRNSVLWGCPEFTKAIDFDTTTGDSLRNGYAMSTQTMAPAAPKAGASKAAPGNLAYIDLRTSGPSVGTWFKASVWTRRGDGGSSNRGVIADGSFHTLSGGNTFSLEDGAFFATPVFGTNSTAAYLPTQTAAPSDNYIGVDGQRHAKPTRNANTLRKSKGVNMLFCDMSVRPVTPAEAWFYTVGGNSKAFTKKTPGPFG